MDSGKIFVGRDAELKQFRKVLEDEQGQAVLVVGQAGMGKTWLINKMVEIAENHRKYKCWSIRYEVTDIDEVNSIAADIMDDAFSAIEHIRTKIGLTKESQEKWKALFSAGGLIPIVGGKVKAAGELIQAAFIRDLKVETRRQFIKALGTLSAKLKGETRLVFFIDPEKYMKKGTDAVWGILMRQLPDRVKFVFAQRKEDVMVGSEVIDGLDNVVYIPKGELGVLSDKDVDDLLRKRKDELSDSIPRIRKAIGRYKGHPYAIGAALGLLSAGVKLEELPNRAEPVEFAAKQWEKICDSKEGAIELFEAYAILAVGVPGGVVETVAGLSPAKRKRLEADKYLAGLLRKEGEGKRIYHSILADYILGQIGDAEKKEYHARAVGIYREKLAKAEKEQVKPDELAARRLAEHVLAAEGPTAFVEAFVNECTKPLFNLGLLDAVISLSERALERVEKDSKEEAMVTGNLGVIYKKWGDLNKAEGMHLKSLEISKKLGRQDGISRQYSNLGLIYMDKGDLDKAEEMFRDGLKIDEKLGRLEGIAAKYGNLGLVYQTKNELDKAEEAFLKILEIHDKLSDQEGKAKDYGNLGNVYKTKGELDKAEKMFRNGLKIDEKLGRLEGMAAKYGNLGVIYEKRGELEKAKEYWQKALELYKKMGMRHKVEEVQGWIEGTERR